MVISAPSIGPDVIVVTGGTVSIFTVAVLFEPAAAPVLLGEAPSVAVQFRLWVPSPLTFSTPIAGDVLTPLRTLIGNPPLSVHAIEVTFDGSVAVTVTATGADLK